MKRLEEFRKKLEDHQLKVKAELEKHLQESKKQIVDYYLPSVKNSPPDALLGQSLSGKPSEDEARQWLEAELNRVFPRADELIQKMVLEERYKDVTFETLNRGDFLELIETAFPNVDWEKAYNEFKAAGEDRSKEQRNLSKR
jgi:hypothetical protein